MSLSRHAVESKRKRLLRRNTKQLTSPRIINSYTISIPRAMRTTIVINGIRHSLVFVVFVVLFIVVNCRMSSSSLSSSSIVVVVVQNERRRGVLFRSVIGGIQRDSMGGQWSGM